MTLHVEHNSTPNDITKRLDIFAKMVMRWNATVNLIANGDVPVLRQRHIEDCLQLRALMPPVKRAIDLGSGAGFPGLILAIATGVHFDLIEADQRKAAFLREACRLTSAPVTVYASRIEATDIPPADLITARALARLPRLLELAAPKLAQGGVCLFMKGEGAAGELTEATLDWHMRVQQVSSRTDRSAKILRLSEITRVPRA